MTTLTIGKVANQAGIGVETIRFYERKGLLAEPPRNDSGYRQYPHTTVKRLRFIRRAKELGFSLKEIKELLVLHADPQATCGDIKQRAELKLADINKRIDDLERMRAGLQILLTSCSSDVTLMECPIMQAIAGE